LFTILMFEATTTFQRMKNLKTLRGMGNKPFPVKVYRGGEWRECLSDDILPGDVISVKRYVEPNKERGLTADAMNVVPADIVLLAGSAVVNEATLTGESVPQIKDGIPRAKGSDALFDMEGAHRMHTLFSGTSLISATQADYQIGVPNPPDGGVIGYVLRIGFDSSQGELMRMIEFSKDEVVGDTRETLMALALLLFFALIAAAYLMKRGLEEGNRTHYELMLKCVLVEEKFPKENFRVNREIRDEILVYESILTKFWGKMASKRRENSVKIWILGFRFYGLGFSELGFRV
jgi:cation-transporting ATPase 13A1